MSFLTLKMLINQKCQREFCSALLTKSLEYLTLVRGLSVTRNFWVHTSNCLVLQYLLCKSVFSKKGNERQKSQTQVRDQLIHSWMFWSGDSLYVNRRLHPAAHETKTTANKKVTRQLIGMLTFFVVLCFSSNKCYRWRNDHRTVPLSWRTATAVQTFSHKSSSHHKIESWNITGESDR